MAKNIITYWIDLQNEKLCSKINKMYYKKIEAGASIYYIFFPKFYPFLLLRLFIILLNLLRFNPKYYYKNKNTFSIKNNKNLVVELFFVFCGLRYFIKEEYTPNYYHNKLADGKLKFIKPQRPLVSIVLPVFNQIEYTNVCLKSLILNISSKYEYEVIVIDDFSTDHTSSVLEGVDGITYIKNEKNIGFLLSCIKGIEVSKGKYICLLNNDTIVLENWLETMVETIEEDKNVGCVGSKLIYPYGLLQEAGGIIYEDGSGVNYGKFQNATYSRYNYKRKVDYCSGASLLFKKEDYELIGGLDTRFQPAYYEDTDFCFSIRHILGKDVVYQPSSCIVHFEGVSSGKRAKVGNVKSYQNINRDKFVEKWRRFLKDGYQKRDADSAAKKYLPLKKMMIIDSYLPFFDKESGSNRLFHLLKIFQSLGYHLIFIPYDSKLVEPYYTLLTSKMAVEVVTKERGYFTFIARLKKLIKDVDVLWICRPKLNKKYKFLIKYNSKVKWIYDTIDLHYIRLAREFNIFPSGKLKRKINKTKSLEIALAEKADFTIAITDTEAEMLKKDNIKKIEVIPNIHIAYEKEIPGFNERKDICFIGSYNHKPNVDAAIWLIDEIMPLVWNINPKIKLFLLGNNPNERMLKYQNERIIVTGFIEDVSPYFLQCRIFVAPLRYGAGMKGKIGQSLTYALPIITTDIGIEGMSLTHNQNVLVANDAETFSKYILDLYNNELLWNKISDSSKQQLKQYNPQKIKEDLNRILA